MTERQQVPLKVKAAAIFSLGGAAFLAACGGGKGEKPQVASPDASGITPVATRTAEPTIAPTAAPTPIPTEQPRPSSSPTATSEPAEVKDEDLLFERMRSAFGDFYPSSQATAASTKVDIWEDLLVCGEKSADLDKSSANYSAVVLNSCAIIATYIRISYQETPSTAAVVALDAVREYAFSRLEEFVNKGLINQDDVVRVRSLKIWFLP